jgi:hypothetical protein
MTHRITFTTRELQNMRKTSCRLQRSAALAGLVVMAVMALAPALQAQEAFGGPWLILSSAPAPWAGKSASPDRAAKALLGKGVAIMADRIDGPKPLLCRKLAYKVTDYTPDMLFQGNLPAPDKQALALGFKAPSIKTLETGCEAGIDFHMVDAMTVLFGLNDRIYTMTRRK